MAGAGSVHVRVLVWTPPPQVTLHVPYAVHVAHPPPIVFATTKRTSTYNDICNGMQGKCLLINRVCGRFVVELCTFVHKHDNLNTYICYPLKSNHSFIHSFMISFRSRLLINIHQIWIQRSKKNYRESFSITFMWHCLTITGIILLAVILDFIIFWFQSKLQTNWHSI